MLNLQVVEMLAKARQLAPGLPDYSELIIKRHGNDIWVELVYKDKFTIKNRQEAI